jgi:hypothetical protein
MAHNARYGVKNLGIVGGDWKKFNYNSSKANSKKVV